MALSRTPQTETVGEAAFRRIRLDIISGVLRPSEKLKLEQLKTKYSVSVSTLREILAQLTAEKLVVAEGQRGFEVSPASRLELVELGDLRALLECHAIETSFAQGDLDWEARVVAAHHKLSAIERDLLAGKGERTVDWVRYDWEFHQALVSACNSATMMKMLASVFDRFLRYHILAESFRGKPVVDDHRMLFEYAMARDVDGACQMLRQHVDQGVAHVLKSGRIA